MDFDPTAMNNAADEAEIKLSELLSDDELLPGIDATAKWFHDWYLKTPDGKPGAGHKRLGRILVGVARDKEQEYQKPNKKKKKGGK